VAWSTSASRRRESGAWEIGEELGFDRAPGRLLVIDFCRRPYVRWEGLRFVFDGGLLVEDDVARMVLPREELCSYAFVDQDELTRRVAPQLAARVVAALGTGPEETVYLENGQAVLAESG